MTVARHSKTTDPLAAATEGICSALKMRGKSCCYWLLQQRNSVSHGGIRGDNCTCCHTVVAALTLQIKLAISSGHWILTPGQPVLALTLYLQAHGRVTSIVPSLSRRYDSTWGRYHGGRRPSSDDSFHSSTGIPPSALDKPSIMKHYHRRRTCRHTSPRRSPTMVALHDSRFVECRWWNDGWTVKTVVN